MPKLTDILTSTNSSVSTNTASIASNSSTLTNVSVDPIKLYDIASNDLGHLSVRHFNRTDYVYIQDGTVIYVWDKTNKTTSSTTFSGLTHISFISDTLAVGCAGNGDVFKITVNGTTLTKGNVATLPSTANSLDSSFGSNKVVGLSSTQAAVLTQYRSSDSFHYWSFAAVDISGSTPSIGSVTTVYAGGQYQNINWNGARVRNGNQFIANGKHGSSNGDSFSGLFYVNGTSLSYTKFDSTRSTGGPQPRDPGLPPSLNEGDSLSWIPYGATEGYYVGPLMSSGNYPNLAVVGFANTTSATLASSMTQLSPSGAGQASTSYLNRVSPVTTTTNNGQYYVFQYITYTDANRNYYRYLYRVQNNSLSVDNNNYFSTSNHDASVGYSIYDLQSNNEFLNFYLDRDSNTQAMRSEVRRVTINTSNDTFTNNTIRTNSLPTSGSDKVGMSTIPTYPLIKDGYQYLLEQDFYAKSNDNWVSHTPGRLNAYIPYGENDRRVRVIDDNLAIVFSATGTRMMEITA